MMVDRHHALGFVLGALIGLLFFGLANGVMAGAAAVSTGEITLNGEQS